MRMSKASSWCASFIAMAAVFVALTTATPSQADDTGLTISCSNGDITLTSVAPWHINNGQSGSVPPWKYVSGDTKLDKSKFTLTTTSAKVKAAKCEGSVNAFICNGDQCKGPIPMAVK